MCQVLRPVTLSYLARIKLLNKIPIQVFLYWYVNFDKTNELLDKEKNKTKDLVLFFVLISSDVNECLDEDLYSCTDEFHMCVNTRGSYKCECEQDLYFIDGKCRGNQR